MTIESPRPINVLVVDDHPLLREGIAALLRSTPDILLTAEASTATEALKRFREFKPDIKLMDLQLPDMNGLDAVAQIHALRADAKIIVLTTYSGDVQLMRAVRAGARAYLLKSQVLRELADTIRAVHAGHCRFDPGVESRLADHALNDALSKREAEVLLLIADGHPNQEIASRLQISEATVNNHLAKSSPS